MEKERSFIGVTMNFVRGCLLVTVQAELCDESVSQIQKEVMEEAGRRGLKGAIIDLSGVDLLGSFLAQALIDMARMLSLQGVTAKRVIFRSGIVG